MKNEFENWVKTIQTESLRTNNDEIINSGVNLINILEELITLEI
jgi:hypothetical protein